MKTRERIRHSSNVGGVVFLLLLLLLLLSLTTTLSSANELIWPTSFPACAGQEYPFLLDDVPGNTWTSSFSPRRFTVNFNMTFTAGTELRGPANLTIANSTVTDTDDMYPLVHEIDLSSYNLATGRLNITKSVVIRSQAGETRVRNALTVGGGNRKHYIRFAGVCGRLLNVTASVHLEKAQIDESLGQFGPRKFAAARDFCIARNMTLPTILKDHEYTEFKNVFDAQNPRESQHLGNFFQDNRPNYGAACWTYDVDYDPSLCTVSNNLKEYFSILRSNAFESYTCKAQADYCNNIEPAGVFPRYDNMGAREYNFSLRMLATNRRLTDTGWYPTDAIPSRVVYHMCMKPRVVYKWQQLWIRMNPQDIYTFSKSPSAAESVSFSVSADVSASFSQSVSSDNTRASASHSLSQIETVSNMSSASNTHSHPTATPTDTRPPPPTDSVTGSHSRIASMSQQETLSVDKTPSSSAETLSQSQPATHSGDDSTLTRSGNTPTRLATKTSLETLTRQRTQSGKVATSSISKTIRIPPPLPTAAPPLPASELAAISTTTSIAASLSGPAAAQTLRSLSILAVIDTDARCKLVEVGLIDKYSSDNRSFPESFVPQLMLFTGSNETIDFLFGLPSRRGAIIANSLIAPVVIFTTALLLGFLRTKISKPFRGVSPMTAGRVTGMVAAVIGSVALDGITAAAVVLCMVPGGPDVGDVVLSIFGFCFASAITIVPGVILLKKMREQELLGTPIECVSAWIVKKTRKKKSGNDKDAARVVESEEEVGETPSGVMWFLFGNEAWSGNSKDARDIVEQYRPIFATSRGMSRRYAAEFAKSCDGLKLKSKIWRRHAAASSFYFDILLTVVAAAGRGWATTRPCESNGKVQLMQLILSFIAFFHAIVIMAPISPLRRLVDLAAGFLQTVGTFTLVLLRAEASTMVGRCALAAAFMSSCSAVSLFFVRRIVLPVRGVKITVAGKKNQQQQSGVGDDGGLLEFADLLIVPFLEGGGGDTDQELRAMPSTADYYHQQERFASNRNATSTADLVDDDVDLSQFLIEGQEEPHRELSLHEYLDTAVAILQEEAGAQQQQQQQEDGAEEDIWANLDLGGDTNEGEEEQ